MKSVVKLATLIAAVRNVRMITLILLLLMIASCASIGHVSSPEFPQLVAKGVPKGDGEIHFFGQGEWHPNTRGFTPERDSFDILPTAVLPGVLVITSTSLLFEQWEDRAQRFDVVKRIPFLEISEVSLDSYGRNRRLVVRKKDLSFDTFSFTSAGGIFVESSKVEEAYQFLQNRFTASK